EQFFEHSQVQEELEAEKDNDLLNPPPTLAPEGFHGVLQEICKISTRYSEASEVAIASNVIATFSAMIGRVAFQHIGDGVCHARPFFLLTGRTGKARKGTSEFTPYRIFKEVEQILNQVNDEEYPILKRHEGGLSTGEGLGWAVHDEILNKEGEVAEEGVNDKRLYVVEAEFAGCIAAASREKNNLSATIRTVWDGKNISPLVKNAKWCATAPHIVISAHITSSELIDRMSDVDAQSGFMNRFIILHIVRPKLVPLPKRTPDEDVQRVAIQIAEAVQFAMGEPGAENNSLEVKLSPEARKYWCGQYRELTREQGGIIGSLLVRTEIYCRMLAMVFALLDKSAVVEVQHIKAALAWIDYWKHSVSYIFGTLAAKAEASKMNETAKDVYEYICKHSGCTRTDLTKFFKHKLNANEMTSALNHLMNAAPPLIRQETRQRADGKPGKGTIVFWKV
ncbi:MAG: DUF3987 domain-containing protein, partial [Methylomarinum sp.]|nr:DUF3987 domain-containing protein [Methylomarinum sp.]